MDSAGIQGWMRSKGYFPLLAFPNADSANIEHRGSFTLDIRTLMVSGAAGSILLGLWEEVAVLVFLFARGSPGSLRSGSPKRGPSDPLDLGLCTDPMALRVGRVQGHGLTPLLRHEIQCMGQRYLGMRRAPP